MRVVIHVVFRFVVVRGQSKIRSLACCPESEDKAGPQLETTRAQIGVARGRLGGTRGWSESKSGDECGAPESRAVKLGAGSGVLLSFQTGSGSHVGVPGADSESNKGLGGGAGSSNGRALALQMNLPDGSLGRKLWARLDMGWSPETTRE